ncbi:MULTISPECIES: hypothetical protein [unclassified Kitasatospora]|uniref:hypothetical protein n=1 Tax=unclassified Kitasatospora TaxID=2633591 RepID=UPI00380F867A
MPDTTLTEAAAVAMPARGGSPPVSGFPHPGPATADTTAVATADTDAPPSGTI